MHLISQIQGLRDEYIIKVSPIWPHFKASAYCLSINTNCGYEISKNGIEKGKYIGRTKGKGSSSCCSNGKIWMFMNKKWGPFRLLPLPIWANARKLSPPDFGFVKQSHRWPRGWLLCINFVSGKVWVWPFSDSVKPRFLVIYVFASR